MYRNTYVEVNVKNIYNNVKKLIDSNKGYEYYFGVVKANAYGHGLGVVKYMIDAGINYLCVATLDEALELRDEYKDIPILCLGYIPIDYIDICIENKITVCVSSVEYAKSIKDKDLLVHIKINTGMNRLGVKTQDEYREIYNLLKDKVEGVFTHIYKASNKSVINSQYQLFDNIVYNKEDIKIVHLSASEATANHKKKDYENGCRLGISMYGLIDNNLSLESTYSLCSEIIEIQKLKKGDTVGYDGVYKAKEECFIAVIPIGYADGLMRKNEGRYIYINNKKYNIVGHVCMDMLFALVDKSVNIHDKVYLLKDINHINYTAKYLDTINYEVICDIGYRVPRVYSEE